MPKAEDENLYELVDDPAPRARTSRAIDPTAAKRVQPIEYHHPATPGTSAVDRLFPDRVKDLYMPLALIGGGAIVHIGYALLNWSRGATFIRAMADLGMSTIVGTALMLLAVLIAAKFRGIVVGPLPVAVLKLAAVAIGPSATAILVAPLFLLLPFIGSLLLWVAQFVMFFALLGALFDLDESDTWYCVAVMFLVNLAVYFAMVALR